MTVSQETQQKIETLQTLEQNMNSILMQKKQIQSQMFEIDSALGELAKVKEAYKIVGGIMVKFDSKNLTEDFSSKKELLNLRLKAVEKQETRMREEATALQKEVMEELKNDTKASS